MSKESLPKTAPSKRKSWKATSCVSLKTEQGEQLELELSPRLIEESPKKHPPIQVSSGGSDSEVPLHTLIHSDRLRQLECDLILFLDK